MTTMAIIGLIWFRGDLNVFFYQKTPNPMTIPAKFYLNVYDGEMRDPQVMAKAHLVFDQVT